MTLFLLLIFLAGFLLYACADVRRKQGHVDLHREIKQYLSSPKQAVWHRNSPDRPQEHGFDSRADPFA